MLQQVIALIVIAFFLSRLFWQKRKNAIGYNEFYFWLIFWSASAFAVVFLKYIDRAVAKLGFSGSGIEILLYVAVIALFYFIFRLRMKLEKIERGMTEIVRQISIKNKK